MKPQQDRRFVIGLAAITLGVQAFLLWLVFVNATAMNLMVWLLLLSLVCLSVLFSCVLCQMKRTRSLELKSESEQHGKDGDTGLPDYSEFYKRMDVECRRSVREFTPLTLMFVGFSGSELSRRDAVNIAETLIRAVYRPGDMVSRINQTTFALVLPATNEHAVQLAERCLENIRALNTNAIVSIGLCTFQPASNLLVDLAIDKGTELLQNAMEEGGDRIVSEAEQQTDPSVTYSY